MSATTTEVVTPKFDADVSACVKFVRYQVHGRNPKLVDDQRPGAASHGDHVAVRTRIIEVIGVDAEVTVDTVLAACGTTLADVFNAGSFTGAIPAFPANVRPVKGESNTAWRSGRYLAGIIFGWCYQMMDDQPKES